MEFTVADTEFVSFAGNMLVTFSDFLGKHSRRFLARSTRSPCWNKKGAPRMNLCTRFLMTKTFSMTSGISVPSELVINNWVGDDSTPSMDMLLLLPSRTVGSVGRRGWNWSCKRKASTSSMQFISAAESAVPILRRLDGKEFYFISSFRAWTATREAVVSAGTAAIVGSMSIESR